MPDMSPDNNRDTFQGRGARIKELEEQVAQLKQKLLEAEQTKGVLCDKCGWSMKFPDEDCRCELEEQVEQLKKKSIESDAMTEDEMAKEIGQMSDEEVKANVDRVFGDDLAKRAVKCKAWRWMRGMMTNWGRVLAVDTNGYAHIWEQAVTLAPMPGDAVPDLADPATVGCILALVREAWEAPDAHTMRYWRPDNTFAWLCVSPDARLPTRQSYGETEAEALVVALESMNDD